MKSKTPVKFSVAVAIVFFLGNSLTHAQTNSEEERIQRVESLKSLLTGFKRPSSAADAEDMFNDKLGQVILVMQQEFDSLLSFTRKWPGTISGSSTYLTSRKYAKEFTGDYESVVSDFIFFVRQLGMFEPQFEALTKDYLESYDKAVEAKSFSVDTDRERCRGEIKESLNNLNSSIVAGIRHDLIEVFPNNIPGLRAVFNLTNMLDISEQIRTEAIWIESSYGTILKNTADWKGLYASQRPMIRSCITGGSVKILDGAGEEQ